MTASPLIRRARIALGVARQVEEAVAGGVPADRKLTAILRRHREYGSRDRRFYGDLAFSCLRWRGWTGSVREAGDVAAVRAHLLDHPQPSPEVRALAGDSGLALPAENRLAEGSLPERAVRFSEFAGREVRPEELVPEWLPRLLGAPPGVDSATFLADLLESFQVRPPLWLRVRGRSAEEFAAELRAAGVDAEPGPRPASVRVWSRPHLDDLDRRFGPCFEVQDLASQAVGDACAPAAGERWWDACAGAGGKALHLADLLVGTGEVLATDVRPVMVEEIAHRARRVGTENLRWRRFDARQPLGGGALFDGVLVDAPCSGLGTWSRSPDARWRESEEHVAANAEVQAALLANGADHVRPGGKLVYSVCTLTRPETTGVVDGFLSAHPDFVPSPPFPVWRLPPEGPCGAMFIAPLLRVTTFGSDPKPPK
jgi:16S rRNA (cytosine967-C5)-methyltransferase